MNNGFEEFLRETAKKASERTPEERKLQCDAWFWSQALKLWQQAGPTSTRDLIEFATNFALLRTEYLKEFPPGEPPSGVPRDIVYAEEAPGTNGGFLITLECGHKLASREKKVTYLCEECVR